MEKFLVLFIFIVMQIYGKYFMLFLDKKNDNFCGNGIPHLWFEIKHIYNRGCVGTIYIYQKFEDVIHYNH